MKKAEQGEKAEQQRAICESQEKEGNIDEEDKEDEEDEEQVVVEKGVN